MKIICIIQARMASTRLPGKVLYPLAQHPMLSIIIHRISNARADEFWLATSTNSEDDILETWGEGLGLKVFRGSSHDVLSRFLHIAKITKPAVIVRCTADNPTVDSALINLSIETFQQTKANYLGGSTDLPLGYAVEVVDYPTLLRIDHSLKDPNSYHRTHVLSAVHELDNVSKISLSKPHDWPKLCSRWTVDTYEDYQLQRLLFKDVSCINSTYHELAKKILDNKNLQTVNVHVKQKRAEEG